MMGDLRYFALWAVAPALLSWAAGCGEQDHADWGNFEAEGGIPGGGGGGIIQEDGGDDTDTADTDTETGTGESECAESEVLEPGTSRCWRRCPVGQQWVDTVCVGSIYFRPWSEAATACASVGSSYRTASRDEMVGLLENCDANVTGSNGDGLCDSCVQSSPCFDMFEFDSNVYWTSTATAPDAFTDPLPWGVSFDVGTVFQSVNTEELYGFRCVRDSG